MRALRRAAVFILLGLTLGTSWVWASPPQTPAPDRMKQVSTPHDLFGYLGGLLTSVWLKTGCGMDPWGRCTPATSQILDTDTGCRIDPLGRCTPAATQTQGTDAGCTIDPNGRCAPNH